MKKLLLTAMITALMIAPMGPAAIAEYVEAPQSSVEPFVPGEVPAEISVSDAVSPAMHGMLLAMLNHDVETFDRTDSVLVWEALYNMLSMYGQLDERAEYRVEDLMIPAETLYDFAAVLLPDLSQLGQLPQELQDRMTYDPNTDSYLVVCGSDALVDMQVESTRLPNGQLLLTGAMVYVDDTPLASFEAVLESTDSMFGYRLVSMELV